MSSTIAGFELPEGASVTSLDAWPSFAEWMRERHGHVNDDSAQDRELFEAYLAGAYWEFQSRVAAKVN